MPYDYNAEREAPVVAQDILYEKGKTGLCVFLIIMAVCGCVMTFFPPEHLLSMNSKVLELFKGNIISENAYIIMLRAGFILVAAYGILNAGSVSRGKKELLARHELKVKEYGFGRETAQKKVAFLENKARIINIILFFMAIVSVLLFAVLFFISAIPYAAKELGKAKIDRTISDFRIYTDLFFEVMHLLSQISFFVIVPFIMRNRMILKREVLTAIIIVSGLSVVHYAYFYFGHFTWYPSFLDFCVLAVDAITGGFAGFSILTEKKKAVLKEFSHAHFNIY